MSNKTMTAHLKGVQSLEEIVDIIIENSVEKNEA